jgi:hypothetical protein
MRIQKSIRRIQAKQTIQMTVQKCGTEEKI